MFFSTLIMKFFLQKQLENFHMKKKYFLKKTACIFLKGIVKKLEGGKYAGCSRPSCIVFSFNEKIMKGQNCPCKSPMTKFYRSQG